jgi:serpin B
MDVMKLAAATLGLAMLPVPAMAQDGTPPPAAQTDPDARIDATLSPDAQAAVTGINAFSLDLYKRAISGDNLFLSPASVSTAVALAYRGAAGKTASELATVLHYSAGPDAYLRSSAAVLATMNFSGQSRVLETMNAIWLQAGMPLQPAYRADLQNLMKAEPRTVDFAANPGKARTEINAWVATATHDRIPDLLPAGLPTGATRAILVNTIYWKGRWELPFDATATAIEPFSRLDGTKQPARLMHQRSNCAVVERDGVQAIALPYVGNEVDMVVFLPHSPKALPRFETQLTDRALARWFETLDATPPRDTILTLPKMHLEAGFDLTDTLAAMGAPTAFGDDADFSAMVHFPYPGSGSHEVGLKISHVIHKAWLDVDEEGAEAAAATAIVDIVTSGRRISPPPPPPIIFRADRPFLFVLRDRRTGLILFMGRYVTPQMP